MKKLLLILLFVPAALSAQGKEELNKAKNYLQFSRIVNKSWQWDGETRKVGINSAPTVIFNNARDDGMFLFYSISLDKGELIENVSILVNDKNRMSLASSKEGLVSLVEIKTNKIKAFNWVARPVNNANLYTFFSGKPESAKGKGINEIFYTADQISISYKDTNDKEITIDFDSSSKELAKLRDAAIVYLRGYLSGK